MKRLCFECERIIQTDSLKNDHICIHCYLDNPIMGEGYRRADDPSPKLMSVEVSDEFETRIEEYWSDRNINNVEDAINNLSSFLEDVETPSLLAKLILHNSLSRQVFLDRGDDTGLGPQFVEYLLGLFACHPPTGISTQYYTFLREATAVSDQIQIADKSQNDSNKKSAAYELAARELTLGHLASPGQHIQAAKRFYQPHSARMESQFGFSIDDVISIVTAIRDEKDMKDSNLYRKEKDTSVILSLLDRIVSSRPVIPDIAEEYESYIGPLNSWGVELATDLYWVEPNRIKKRTSLSNDRSQAILDFLSIELGEADGFRDPSNHNPLHETPLLKHDNRYLLPPKGLIEYTIATTFKYHLRSSNYADEFNDTMGDVVEQWTEDILRNHLKEPTVATNVEYQYNGKKYETDLVLIAGNTIVIFECKSKGLTLPTRKGHRGGTEKIQKDVQKGLGKAYSQAHRLIDAIESGVVTNLSGGSLSIDVSHCTEFQPCAIVPEAYDSLITTNYSPFIQDKKYPLYAASVFDLEPVAATLTSPNRFTEYLKWRSSLVTNNDVYTPDEDDLLQAFLNDYNWITDTDSTANIAGIGSRFKYSLYDYDKQYAYEPT